MELTRWYRCPHCGGKVLKLTEDSVVMCVPLYCKRCHTESEPWIYAGRVYSSDEPFPLFAPSPPRLPKRAAYPEYR